MGALWGHALGKGLWWMEALWGCALEKDSWQMGALWGHALRKGSWQMGAFPLAPHLAVAVMCMILRFPCSELSIADVWDHRGCF